MKKLIKKSISQLAGYMAYHPAIQGPREVDLYIKSLLEKVEDLEAINDPRFVIRNLRACFMHYPFKIIEIKNGSSQKNPGSLKFSRLIEALKEGVHGIPGSIACDITLTADEFLAKTNYDPDLGADVAWHFKIASSYEKSGRLLFNVVRFMRPRFCLEAGTAYGMSSLYLLHALSRYCPDAQLHTIEASDLRSSLAEKLLTSRFDKMVICYHGLTEEYLPTLASQMEAIDFLFHDAGHSHDDYVRDFNFVSDKLASGSVVLFDDIYWNDPRFSDSPPRCYEGWREIVAHPRVSRAVEVDDWAGMILVH